MSELEETLKRAERILRARCRRAQRKGYRVIPYSERDGPAYLDCKAKCGCLFGVSVQARHGFVELVAELLSIGEWEAMELEAGFENWPSHSPESFYLLGQRLRAEALAGRIK